MGKTYNVIFNSSVGITANTSVESFFFDWSQLPRGEYKCYFSFYSGNMTLTNANIANVFMDLGCSKNLFAVNPITSYTPLLPSYIGCLQYSGTGAGNRLYADINTNTPFYLDARPSNNNVTVSVIVNTATQNTAYTPATSFYTLTLCLELQD